MACLDPGELSNVIGNSLPILANTPLLDIVRRDASLPVC